MRTPFAEKFLWPALADKRGMLPFWHSRSMLPHCSAFARSSTFLALELILISWASNKIGQGRLPARKKMKVVPMTGSDA